MRGMRSAASVTFIALFALGCYEVNSYYLPGTFPQAYSVGAKLQAEVNSLRSYKSELAYDFYSFPVCKPVNGVRRSPTNVNIGTLLTGQRIQNTPYNFTLLKDETGIALCQRGPLTADEVKSIEQKIRDGYRVNMILDNLPVTTYDLEQDAGVVRPGFELGYELDGGFFVNNHLVFTILVHRVPSIYRDRNNLYSMNPYDIGASRRLLQEGQPEVSTDEESYTVVGFEVSACSVGATSQDAAGSSMFCLGGQMTADARPESGLKVTEGVQIPYSYDVHWKLSDITWASRWDAYLKMPRGRVHWFSVVNSIVVALVLSGVVMIILFRTVRRDLLKYEEVLVDAETEFKEEYGWKLVMGDVFRAPPAPLLLSVQAGSGVQIALCSVVTMVFAALGFLSPASRGALLSTCIGVYILLSIVAGFAAVWLHGMMFQSYSRWAAVALRTCGFFPGIAIALLTVVNLLLRQAGTLGFIPIKAWFMILFLWWLVSTPLCLLGGFLASRLQLPPHPVRTNQIPRQIPPQRVHGSVYFLGSGLLVFGNIFIVLYFTMTSMWQGYFYYLFGFVLIATVLTCLITAQVSVVATYLQLCTEDYRWWWSSFLRGGAVAVYVLAYAVVYLAMSLSNMHGLSVLVYLCYMCLLSFSIFLMLGTVGFLASYYFTYKIFASVKSD